MAVYEQIVVCNITAEDLFVRRAHQRKRAPKEFTVYSQSTVQKEKQYICTIIYIM